MRALMLGLMLTNSNDALDGLEGQLEVVGLRPDVRGIRAWGKRIDAIERADARIRQADIRAEFGEVLEFGARRFAPQRRYLWEIARTSPEDPANSVAWLSSVMYDAPEAPDGVAAAAALSHWRRPTRLSDVPRLLRDATRVLARASEGPDGAARDISLAATGSGMKVDPHEPDYRWQRQRGPARHDRLSLAVHGTWGWRGEWWFPGGNFHKYVHEGPRPNIYAGGAPFSWDGAYSTKSRAKAAKRLTAWANDMAGTRVDTAFAHSYGGGVALMSTASGTKYENLVLLSTPVHNSYDIEWRNIGRTNSVRLDFDIVLAAARARQRFRTNVDEYVLPLHSWRHGATHDPDIWAQFSIASQIGL